MKKLLLLLLAVLVIFTVGTYIFIPGTMVIDRSVSVHNNIRSAYRCFSENSNWGKWWPGKTNSGSLAFDGNTYSVNNKTVSSVFVDISNGYLNIPGSVTFIPGEKDTFQLNWYAKIPGSKNPFKRLVEYFAVKKAAGQVEFILKKMADFGSSTANLYSLGIKRDFVKDSALVSISDSTNGYPSTQKIYSLIDQLREYVQSQQAAVTDSPMLNIFTSDKIHYQVKVALPTSRRLPSKGKIEYRWMLAGGNILTADVKGGQKAIDSAFTIVENYMQDHQLMAPAIPFYSLISNRLSQKDSTQWVTRIYYPVMYYYD